MRRSERLRQERAAAGPAGAARACAGTLAHGRDGGVPAREPRSRALRRRLPLDARAGRPRRGGVRRSARLHAERGLPARPAARRRAARRVRAARAGHAGLSGHPPDRERARLGRRRPQPDRARPLRRRRSRRLHWRSDFSSVSPDGAGASPRRRRAGAAARGRAAGRSDDASRCPCESAASRSGSTSRPRTREHRVVLLPLGQKGPGSWQLSATVPAGVRQIVGLEISLTNAAAYVLQHREAEGVVGVGAFGLAGARLAVGGRRRCSPTWHGWLALGGAALDRAHGLLLVHLRPDDASPPAAGDRQPAASRHRQSRGRAGSGAGRLADAGVSAGAGAGADRRRGDALPRCAGVRRRVRDRRREPPRDRPRREPARHRNTRTRCGCRFPAGRPRGSRASCASRRSRRSTSRRGVTSSTRSPAIRSPAGRRSRSASPRSSRCCSRRSGSGSPSSTS